MAKAGWQKEAFSSRSCRLWADSPESIWFPCHLANVPKFSDSVTPFQRSHRKCQLPVEDTTHHPGWEEGARGESTCREKKRKVPWVSDWTKAHLERAASCSHLPLARAWGPAAGSLWKACRTPGDPGRAAGRLAPSGTSATPGAVSLLPWLLRERKNVAELSLKADQVSLPPLEEKDKQPSGPQGDIHGPCGHPLRLRSPQPLLVQPSCPDAQGRDELHTEKQV